MKLLVKTLAGLEEVLAEELKALGATEIEILKRAVRCEGDQAFLYKANLCLHTAIRILVPVKEFEVQDEEDLYNQLRPINWESYMRVYQSFAVDVVTQSAQMRHSHYLALKSKDAIVDWFREKRFKRPSVDVKKPDIKIHLHIDARQKCTLLLDSSGDGLHRRGYRTSGGAAPLNEVLAAGMIKLSGWNADQPFVDMMCGSGTLLIEAGLLAINRAPGLSRSFAFQKWEDFDKELWQKTKQTAREQERDFEHPIIGIDTNFKAVRVAEQNIEAAGLDEHIRVRRSNFERYLPPLAPATLVINPPYGLRVESDDIIELYKSIGDKLKQDFSGYNAWILSANMDAIKRVGLRPKRRIPLMNGQLECKFHGYELYKGTKKLHKIKPSS